jgi:GNAT superfamily N-acetyltransferase
MSLSLRPPQASEIEQVRRWLPFPFECPGSLLCLVAVDPGECLGAVTLNALEVEGQLVGGLAIYVDPKNRRRGIGSALLVGALNLARETGMQRVATLDFVDQASELCPFLEARGLQRAQALTTYALPLAETLAALEARYAVLQELIARGHGPAIGEVRSLADVDPQRVLAFVREQGRGTIGTNLMKLSSEAFRCTSTVLLDNDAIVGVLLGGVEGATSYIDLLLVAENKRHSTAELVLLLEGSRRASALGVAQVRFDAHPETHPFPVKVGRRLQAKEISERYTFEISREDFPLHREHDK